MKKIVLSIAIAATLAAADAGAADVIHFTPGPYGGSKIITPWGDFLAIPSGNSIWIGTVEEYMDNKADFVAEKNGFKKANIAGQGKNERNYVQAKAMSATVGKTDLYQITTSILFGVQASKKEGRPPKKQDSEYVSLVWNQSASGNMNPRLVTADGQRAFAPNSCGKSDVFFYCEFTVGRQELTGPMMYVFAAKGARPAAVPVESVAKQHFKDIQLKYRTILRGVDPDGETTADIQKLHELDESIPLSIR